MTKISSKLRLAVLAIAAFAVLVAACDSSSTPTTVAETTTTQAQPDDSEQQALVFGNGEMPNTVPKTFPIPEQAVVGATMIDRTRGLTEVVLTFPANVPEVVTFFEANLAALGWSVDASSGNDGEWTLEYSGELGSGEVLLKTGGSGLSQGTLRIIDPSAG